MANETDRKDDKTNRDDKATTPGSSLSGMPQSPVSGAGSAAAAGVHPQGGTRPASSAAESPAGKFGQPGSGAGASAGSSGSLGGGAGSAGSAAQSSRIVPPTARPETVAPASGAGTGTSSSRGASSYASDERRTGSASRPSGSSFRDQAEDVGERAREGAEDLQRKAGELYEDSAEWVRDSYERAADWASDRYAEGSRRYGRQARESWSGTQRFVQDNPVLVGVVGLAAGLLIGSLLPRTRHEDRAFGRYADDVREQGLRYAREAARRGRDYAEHAFTEEDDPRFAHHESEFRRDTPAGRH